MSSKPPAAAVVKAGFANSNSSTQFQTLMYNSIYNMGSSGNEELNLASAATVAAPNFYTRNMKSLGEGEGEGEYGLAKAEGGVALDMVAAAAAAAAAARVQEMGSEGDDGGIGVMKRWGGRYEQEKSYSMSPLMEIAGAAAQSERRGNQLLASSSCAAAVDYLPLANNASTHTPYNLDAADFRISASHSKYSTQDMEILRVKQPLNTTSGSVQQLFYDHIPSSLGISASLLANFHTHTHTHTHPPPAPPPPSSSSLSDHHHLQLLGDHPPPHQWSSSTLHPPGASHPHAELLLLPGVSDTASPLHTHSAALPSSQLDLLHTSSLHDKQAPLHQLPLGPGTAAAACGGSGVDGHFPSAASQMWNMDKLDMAVGLGLRDHAAATRSAPMFAQDVDHFASARHAHGQSGLSLFLQSPHQRAQTVLSLDAARYSSRTATGAVGVLRNSKYLKAAQQLLNEFCNVCKDVAPDVKSSMQGSAAASSLAQHNIWTGSNAEDNINIAGDDHAQLLHRALFSATQKDMSVLYPSSEHNYKGSIEQSITSIKHMKQANDHHHQQNPHAEAGAAIARGLPSPSHLNDPLPPKQLPADERCHLQMRKARLIAMVEELDRRYQQYRDQMQLIITSFESATGMGAAAAYTTLAKKAMSRQFRGLRDAISEHISKVCKLLGEEVSSVPILSRGETPRLRLVDQRLRHQRSLQQIGMLPQQQAWRPQRGLPERSVSVLRAWLFEHFLHPYPKDSEKSMLARLTGLSRNQVSNWFINARVRLWKPMVEEMYVEESKALEMSEGEGSHAAEVMQGISPSDQGQSDRSSSRQNWQQTAEGSSRQSWQQQPPSAPTPIPAPASSFSSPEVVTLYNTRSLHRDDINSFMQLHSSGHANDTHTHAHGGHVEATEHQYSWMKGMQEEHGGDMGMLTHQHDHIGLQAAALMHGQLNAAPAFMKNGVSLTLGLQQPPPHSSYNTTSSAYGRPSEALLF